MMEHRTARFRIFPDAAGSRYRFFCEASGMAVCTTQPVRADTQEEELRRAWEAEGRRHFNQCQKCGKWVSDVMYNPDTGRCVSCSPWEDTPDYCSNCGHWAPQTDHYCRSCGEKLQYREVMEDGPSP